ncbi:MAG: serine/threonine protein kinase, partial [Bdellovibrionales bacterium]|nr:serine/threonine protein kinase [Bdellovibrionales bacterium]
MGTRTSVYGKYLLLDRIAVGGMAEVFKAKSFGIHGFERILVIKRILPHLTQDKEFVEMFIDEAKIAVELTHANICQVSELGKIGDNYFIAMEYIHGKDLRAILKKCYTVKRQLSIAQALHIILETLKGLDYAHNRIDSLTGKPLGLIHRDISPQNIMISYYGEVKIVDFGIAKTESKLHRTQAGVLKGKFGYMSPEQAAGLELDQRTDLFSTGILLYEMLTNRRLFHGDSDFKTLEAIKECVIPSPRKYNPNIPPELEQALMKALSKEREDRFFNVQEMHAALSKIFYTTFPDYTTKDLSDFLMDIFKVEIAEEQESLKRALDQISKDDFRAASSASESDIQGHSHPKKSDTASVVLPSSIDQQKQAKSILSKLFILGAVAFTLIFGYWKFFHKGSTISLPLPSKAQSITLNTLPPGASISIEGEARGEAPLTVRLIPEKTYQLSIQLAGYETYNESFSITSKQTVYDFTLTKKKALLGSIFVKSDPPGAKIAFNQTTTEMVTPATIYKLKLNQEHEITVEKEGYKTSTKTIYLKDVSQDVSFSLEKIGGQIKINVIPKNADIYLNGKSVSNTMEGLELGKKYEITLKS